MSSQVKTITVDKNIQSTGIFRALRHRNFRLWFVGQGISLVGTWMQTMAQQVLVYRLTGTAASLGIISFIGLIPLIPLSLWGGSISDRFPKRTVILCTQALMLVQAFLLAGLCWSGSVQIWHVYVMAFLLGAANAVDMPARQSFTIDMVEGKEDLTNAIGLNSAIFNGARALGPAIAGMVVAATGEAMAFGLNGISFIAVIFSLLMMRNLPQPKPVDRSIKTIQHLSQGIKFVVKNQAVMVLISLVAVSSFLSMPYSTLMPVFANNILKDSALPVISYFCGGLTPIFHCLAPEALPLGILFTTVGFGAVIGALVIASFSEKSRRGQLLTAGNLTFPVMLLIMAVSRSFILTCLALLFVGFSFVCQNALANTLLQLVTPDEVRGRVMSLFTLVLNGMMRLGGLQAGFMADWLGAPVCIGLGAGISLLYGTFVALKYPAVRKL
jgi:MFS family permease